MTRHRRPTEPLTTALVFAVLIALLLLALVYVR